jgi:quercetin dioxygenase-like cupin family protein
MPFYNLGDRERKQLAPAVTLQTFWGARIHLSVVTIEPGGSVPRHSHEQEQAGTVLEGEMVLGIGGEEKTVRPGDFYVVPRDVVHWVKPAKQRVVALDVFSPPREDYMY